MPVDPIPITPPAHAMGNPNSPSSSSVSISPQTPFHAPQTFNGHPSPAKPLSPGTNTGFFKWATAAANLGKSPPAPTGPTNGDSATATRGFDIPTIQSHDDHDHEHEHHDSFEFGDFDDLKQRSWNKTRRAVSMSNSAGQQSGITAMLSGFGAMSPPAGGGAGPGGGFAGKDANPFGPGANPMSVPNGGVLADKVARGQGVLRRLSMSGTNFSKSPLSPPIGSASNPLPSFPPAVEPASVPESTVQRAATISSTGGRGRRFSESKKRGVSPMGERILRDHGHF